MARQKIDGNFTTQYALLRDYCKELVRANPRTSMEIEVEKEFNPSSLTRQFKRVYICLAPLREGFKACGRDLLGLDGCFMKGPFPGQILTAVGVDSNNCIYPVAYALVEVETTELWTWFLECLGRDLDLYANSNFTFISDRQKVFNRQLVGGRDKPIITYLEFIREYLTKRIVLVRKSISKCDGPLTPKATILFEGIKKDALLYKVIWNGMNKYQVSGLSQDQCIVDVDKKTCSCRMWELIAMPCKHAVAVNYNMAQNGMDVDIPEAWISKVYLLDTWKKVYGHTIDPINGVQMWTPSECPTTLKPPKHHKQIGRPKKKRKKSAEELSELAREGKMPRSSNTVTCRNCKTQGHNIRSCTAPKFSSQPEKKKGTAKGKKSVTSGRFKKEGQHQRERKSVTGGRFEKERHHQRSLIEWCLC
ncbi:uncharacterized protein LOC143617133 [Bidens hawaiensis]|uniref:uncharacterized protein LOC143617133 n=1 Tax=Bidens hawaiensis TaxID=980011 RepID=UPI00404959AE